MSRNSGSVHSKQFTSDLLEKFVLPANYVPEVEAGLKYKSMNVATARLFISSIARAMYAVKKYPTSAEFDAVGRLVIDKYPFLKSLIGNGFVCGVCMFISCLLCM